MTKETKRQAIAEVKMLKDLQLHVLDVSKRILIQQKIKKLEAAIAEETKNTSRPGLMSLRSRLRYLVALILPHTGTGEKGATQDA